MKSNVELRPSKAYTLTHSRSAKKLSEAPEVITISAVVLFDRPDAYGEVKTVTAIETVDGTVYVSNSPSIAQSFAEMIDFNVLPEGTPVKIIHSKSRNGREYLLAELA